MNRKLKFALAAIALSAPMLVAELLSLSAATVPLQTVQTCTPDQILNCVNGAIGAVNTNINAQTMGAWSDPRSYLDNGGMFIAQRGTGIQTCGTTTVPITSYSADRWGCNANVASGAGRQQVSTSSPPAGFTQYQTLYRTSGALTQPVCSIQEVETARAVQLQGQQVTLSFLAAALAGLAADNGNLISAVIVTGTGTDEGLQSFTASPAITPAWTGIATQINQPFTITTTFTKYMVSATIPATAKEIGVMMCFTPTATGAGVTDGFAFTGVQLEQGASASPFEYHLTAQDLAIAQRYYYQITDNLTNTHVFALGQATTTTAAIFVHPFPVTMRAAPTATASAATAFSDTATAGSPTACTAFAVVASATSTVAGATTCTTGATMTAGGASQLVGANTGANVNFSADF
jgi:hypothetical protein